MISKKDWNTLPLSVKRNILAASYGNDFEQHPIPRELLYEYKHDFDFDETGRRLKKVLSFIYRVNDHEVYVKLPITYAPNSSQAKFLVRPEASKKVAKAPTNKVVPVTRCTWYCDYISKTDGDLCHVWCMAESKEEARSYIMSEYWDIKEIVNLYRKY